MTAGRCVPPRCVCRSRARSTCSLPNRWHVFRRAHRSEFTRSQLSAAYRRAVSANGPADWCAEAAALGMQLCVPLDGVRATRRPVLTPPSVGANPCRVLLDGIPAAPADLLARRKRQWAQVHRSLALRWRFPSRVTDYTPTHLGRIADVVGETFFGREFVPALRSGAGWTIRVDPDSANARLLAGAACTGYVTRRRRRRQSSPIEEEEEGGDGWVTLVNAALVDRYIPADAVATTGRAYVTNDEFPVQTRLQWVAHIVGHELVHCLQLMVCGYPHIEDGHDRVFRDLNGYLLGGQSHEWRPRAFTHAQQPCTATNGMGHCDRAGRT